MTAIEFLHSEDIRELTVRFPLAIIQYEEASHSGSGAIWVDRIDTGQGRIIYLIRDVINIQIIKVCIPFRTWIEGDISFSEFGDFFETVRIHEGIDAKPFLHASERHLLNSERARLDAILQGMSENFSGKVARARLVKPRPADQNAIQTLDPDTGELTRCHIFSGDLASVPRLRTL